MSVVSFKYFTEHESRCVFSQTNTRFFSTAIIRFCKDSSFVSFQQYNGYNYATLHSHVVDGQICVADGHNLVNIEPGWEVAPGNDPDVHRVCGAHAWQSPYLTLADGGYCCTAPNGSNSSVVGKCVCSPITSDHAEHACRKVHKWCLS
jgi:hypothetical protein